MAAERQEGDAEQQEGDVERERAPDGGAGRGRGSDRGPGRERAALAAAVCAALQVDVPGSRAALGGSLARGTADAYSDIDVEWVVPDAEFEAAVAPDRVRALLGRLQPVADLRIDPDHRHSDRRRLLFARFAGVPLWWRLDLSVRAASVAHDTRYDDGNPAARAGEGEWSRPASALSNAVGAVKAVARHRFDDARGLLDRGFARIGAPAPDRGTGTRPSAPDAGGSPSAPGTGPSAPGTGTWPVASGTGAPPSAPDAGAWLADIVRLARAAVQRDPSLTDYAEQVIALATAELAARGGNSEKRRDPGKG